MPLPDRSDVHLDAPLTNISIAYMQSEANFIARKVFPAIPVTHQSNKYFTYNKADNRRNEVKPRAPGDESAGGGFRMSSDSYSCEVYAYHKDIPFQVRSNADAAINVDRDATRFVTDLFMIHEEVQWTSDYFATGVWDTDKTGSTDFAQWSDASSDPEKDLDDGKGLILKSTGKMPNTLVVGYEVHQALKRHPLVQQRFHYTSSDSITEAMLAKFLEIDRYMVSKASYDTSNEGGTATPAFIAGKNALLCYSAPAPGLMVPSAGYTFVWSGLTGANSVGVRIKNFPLERNASDRIEGEYAYDNKVTGTDLGYFFSAAVA
jgi:hypothetical protein